MISAHYDHLGIVKSVDGDSIANGADDDASGTTAVISLAQYYKKLNNNERTLIFVAFTAEEVGGFGARHFSSLLNPDDVVAMFNIEMIGKESKFGKNAAFITGYERSDFGLHLITYFFSYLSESSLAHFAIFVFSKCTISTPASFNKPNLFQDIYLNKQIS